VALIKFSKMVSGSIFEKLPAGKIKLAAVPAI
jgi:hypothetical protein